MECPQKVYQAESEPEQLIQPAQLDAGEPVATELPFTARSPPSSEWLPPEGLFALSQDGNPGGGLGQPLTVRFVYDPAGPPPADSGEQGSFLDYPSPDEAAEPFSFASRGDAGLGLEYNRCRCCEPAGGRWLADKPIASAGADANLGRSVGQADGPVEPQAAHPMIS